MKSSLNIHYQCAQIKRDLKNERKKQHVEKTITEKKFSLWVLHFFYSLSLSQPPSPLSLSVRLSVCMYIHEVNIGRG